MTFKLKQSVFIVPVAACLLAGPARAQEGVLRLQLETTKRFETAQPLSDLTGEHWAWRSAEAIALVSNALPTTKLSGVFLKHNMSANGAALLALEKNTSLKEEERAAGLVLHWFNQSGVALGVHRLPWHDDDPLPHFIVNSSGSHALVVEPGSARATFLMPGSPNAQSMALFEEAPYTNERPLFLAASATHFYIFTQFAPSTSQQMQAPTLICFAIAGKEKWRRALAPGTAGALALSPNAKALVVHRYHVHAGQVEATTTIFDAEGRERVTIPGLFRAAVFSLDGRYVFLMDRRELRCVNARNGATIWRSQLQRRDEMFVALTNAESPAACFVLIAQNAFEQNRFVYKNARLAAFSATGKSLTEHPVSETLSTPYLIFSDARRKVLLAAQGQLLSYKFSLSSSSRLE